MVPLSFHRMPLCLPIVLIVKFTMENKKNKANWIIVYLPYIYRLKIWASTGSISPIIHENFTKTNTEDNYHVLPSTSNEASKLEHGNQYDLINILRERTLVYAAKPMFTPCLAMCEDRRI